MKNYSTYNFDLDRAFRTWELQKGYPVINVQYDQVGQAFHVTQQRFFEYKKTNSDDVSSWYIPINFATASNPNFADTRITHFFEDGEDMLHIPVTQMDTSQWFIFNKQQFGYYRVNYDESNWRTLIYALNSDDYSKIHVMNRAQLIDDAFALAKGGYIDYRIAYDILKYLTREDDFFPWYTAYRHLNVLSTTYGRKNPTLNV